MQAGASEVSLPARANELGRLVGEGDGGAVEEKMELTLSGGLEAFHCPELLFQPRLVPGLHTSSGDETRADALGACDLDPRFAPTDPVNQVGLVELVLDSLRSLEPDFWEDLLKHIVVAGQRTDEGGSPQDDARPVFLTIAPLFHSGGQATPPASPGSPSV